MWNAKLHSWLKALYSCSPVCLASQIVLFNMFSLKPTINKLTAPDGLGEPELPEVDTLEMRQDGRATPIWKYLTPWSGNPMLECFRNVWVQYQCGHEGKQGLSFGFLSSRAASNNFLSHFFSLYTCVKPHRGVFSDQTIAVPRPCFLFLCQLFLSAALTGSLLDNSVSLLPARASCFHCMKFNQELVLLASPTGLLLLYRGGTAQGPWKHYPFHESKTYRKTIYACVDVWTERRFDYLQEWSRGTHTEQWETHMRFQTLSVQCLLKTICFFLSCCLVFFSVLHLCWSFLVQTHWSQPGPLPLDSCWSPLRK